jgi:DNA-directed RNA polymerase specialized sigma24 family protein
MALPKLSDADWFDSEIKPHESALRGYLFHHVPESVDVDDVVQEAYRRILDVRKKKTIEHPRGLLFTIARNAATDLFRKRKSSRTISITEIETVPVLDSTDNPVDLSEGSGQSTVLEDIVASTGANVLVEAPDPNAPLLSLDWDGGSQQFQLQWDVGELQTSTDLNTWTDLGSAESPYTIVPSVGPVFWRLEL